MQLLGHPPRHRPLGRLGRLPRRAGHCGRLHCQRGLRRLPPHPAPGRGARRLCRRRPADQRAHRQATGPGAVPAGRSASPRGTSPRSARRRWPCGSRSTRCSGRWPASSPSSFGAGLDSPDVVGRGRRLLAHPARRIGSVLLSVGVVTAGAAVLRRRPGRPVRRAPAACRSASEERQCRTGSLTAPGRCADRPRARRRGAAHAPLAEGRRRTRSCDLLGGRPGWRLEPRSTPGATPLWCFVVNGKIEFSVTGRRRVRPPLRDGDRPGDRLRRRGRAHGVAAGQSGRGGPGAGASAATTKKSRFRRITDWS